MQNFDDEGGGLLSAETAVNISVGLECDLSVEFSEWNRGVSDLANPLQVGVANMLKLDLSSPYA